jgi:hypothetical protein
MHERHPNRAGAEDAQVHAEVGGRMKRPKVRLLSHRLLQVGRPGVNDGR